ncbi:sodium-dependent transporter [Corynebacterium terpenotabidum]|uniref:Transporter n=1 Tax=Corynebacterium terpenotabidum Y-11 TaxID=1200352 RepID=S4XF80_9CORY|nr:sodium-dependent transporter [Corynebacterium terpenotabidum]AGP31201.1 methionine and alanine importer large subunit [Corynebacterium terpenotabidum Y-11]
MSAPAHGTEEKVTRDTFNSRMLFIFAAIGSAVGLGNIWRFPYVAYESGGGAFLIPYLFALLTAGIPLLWLFFGLGHRFRGSAPMVFRRLHPKAEIIGWLQTGVAGFIGLYYAVVLAWAGLYVLKSFTKSWGDDPTTYFASDFLQADRASGDTLFSGHIVWPILIAMIVVWVFTILTLIFDVSAGIGRMTMIFIPVLVILFSIMVIRALFLDGAATGLDALFSPDWSALKDSSVWIAAYGQIFFSLSIGFGIMITYASYLKPRTNLTANGLVTGFANSAFEVLAGIGVFAALGFMAVQQNVSVDEVASSGIGLSFMAFPAIINEMPAGGLFGVLFFASLFIAGLTSLISIIEVVISAVADKLGIDRRRGALYVGIPMAVVSCLIFSTSTGLMAVDIVDKFTNNLGIVFCAILATVVLAYVLRRTAEMQRHLNAVSTFRVGPVWKTCAFVITPAVLIYTLSKEVYNLITDGYEEYTSGQVFTWGWMVLIIIAVAGFSLTFVSFQNKAAVLDGVPGSDFGVPVGTRDADAPNRFQVEAEKAAATTDKEGDRS